MLSALRTHWPEYLIEACLLGIFMIAACVAVALIEHPESRLRTRIRPRLARRALIGCLMGLTAIALVYSPAGRLSGAHLNPAVTLTFLTLGKLAPWDAVFYCAAQFIGGAAGVAASRVVLGHRLQHDAVHFAVTQPGLQGRHIAWISEFVISFVMMAVVLASSNHPLSAPYTGVLTGLLVALFILVEAPFSGMSMNPARTLASALAARSFRGLWVYFTAPPLAMLAAGAAYTGLSQHVYCAKICHGKGSHCVFRCDMESLRTRIPSHTDSIQAGPHR